MPGLQSSPCHCCVVLLWTTRLSVQARLYVCPARHFAMVHRKVTDSSGGWSHPQEQAGVPPEQAAYLSFWDLWEVAVDTTGCVGCQWTS